LALLTTWPVVNDDSGTGTDGTVVSSALTGSGAGPATMKAAIEAAVHSATNPTITPAATTDEVVEARGNKTTLDQRLSGVIDDDGNLIASGVGATVVQVKQQIGSQNLAGNDDFLVWPDGDTSAPIYWTLAGAGATIARIGTGLADADRKVGDFAAKVTRSGTDAILSQDLLPATDAFARANFVVGETVGAGVWVLCASANTARIAVTDGSATTNSSYHTGGGAWEFLSLSHTIDAGATKLTLQLKVDTNNVAAKFSGAAIAFSPVPLSRYTPCPVGYGYFQFEIAGAVANATDVKRTSFHRAGIVKDIQGYLKTAGTTVSIDVLSNTNTTPTYASMLAAVLAFGASKYVNGQPTTGTYARRCLRGAFSTSPGNSSLVSFDVSAVTGAPADMSVSIRVLQYLRPLERFLNFNQ